MAFKTGEVTCDPRRSRRSWAIDGVQDAEALHNIWACMLREVGTYASVLILLGVNLFLETLASAEHGWALWFACILWLTNCCRYENRYPGCACDVWVFKQCLYFSCWYDTALLMPTLIHLNQIQIGLASMLTRRRFKNTSRTLQLSTILCRL